MRLTLTCLSIFIFGFALLSLSWSNPFVFDDLTKIYENQDLRTPFELGKFIYPYSEQTMSFRNDPSRPLVFMAYWGALRIGEGSPVPFHMINTLVHALNAVLVTLLAFQLVPSLLVAGTAGVLFASSPLLVGTAAYIYGLSDLLGALFILAGLLCLFTKRWNLTWLGYGFYVLALLSKQSAIVFPALVFILDYFSARKFDRRRVMEYATLAGLSLIYLIARWLYFGGIGDLEGLNQTLPMLEYAPTQSIAIFKYLGQIFAPIYMSIDHRPLPSDFPQWVYLTAWLIIAALAIAAIRVRNWLGLGWVFFLICLLPTSSFMPTVDLYVERRGYLAAVGIFVCISILFWKYAKAWPRVALAAVTLAIVAQSVVSVARINVHGDPARLWEESLALDNDNPRALINLAVHYSSLQKWEESRELLERLMIQQPANGSIYTKLGYIYHQKSYSGYNPGRALELYERGLEIYPENIFGIYNLATLKFDLGKYAEAETLYLRSVELAPQMTRSLVAAGQAAIAQNKNKEAAAYLQRALSINPNLEDARVLLQSLQQ